jgi:hypothetical protein
LKVNFNPFFLGGKIVVDVEVEGGEEEDEELLIGAIVVV